jgi:hypothetical protein
LTEEGHHQNLQVVTRANRTARTRLPQTPPVPNPARFASDVPASPSAEPRDPLPLPSIEAPRQGLPPFSLMWLNNPDFSERPRFDLRIAPVMGFGSPFHV